MVLSLSDGKEVKLRETWAITDDDSFPEVEIIDCETNHVLKVFRGELPDTDDPDFNQDELIDEVERILKEV